MHKAAYEKKKVIIIGAGLAGMSAGYYLQVNGFDTEIFEMHSSPGGLCTSWERSGYMIDGCIHFMVGVSPEEGTYRFWDDLLDMKSIRFIFSEAHAVVENAKRERIHFYSDVDRLEQELLLKAPEDRKNIKKFIAVIRKFIRIRIPYDKPMETMGMRDKLKAGMQMLPYIGSIYRLMRIKNKEYAARFTNEDLRRAFETAFVPDAPFFYSVLPLVWRHKKEAGYPEGGAIRIAGLIEKKYLEAGGKIRYQASVKRIRVENNMACGIELENGEQHPADIVVSAADGQKTVYQLLDAKFKDKKTADRYENNVFETIDKTLYVSIGVNRDFRDEPHKLFFTLDTPLKIDPLTTLDFLEITHYCGDPAAAPPGKSLLTLMPESRDWEYWEKLRKEDRQKYNQEKARISAEIIDALDKRFGGIRDNIEMVDVVTPATYMRYTNNWTGGQASWKGTRKTFGKSVAWQIRGLKHFYMTGQWAGLGGGLNYVVTMGNHLTQIICKKEGKKFY